MAWGLLGIGCVCASLTACSREGENRSSDDATPGGASGAGGTDGGGGADAGGGGDAEGGRGDIGAGGTPAGGTGSGGTAAGGDAGGTGSGGTAAGGDAGGGGAAAGGPGVQLDFGYPVYAKDEIDSWSPSSAEYTRLARSWAGNVDRAYDAFGDELSSVERDILKDESVYLKVQAVLWAADGDDARRQKVATLLDDLRTVASWQWDAGEQYRLVAGWSCTNLAQAAALTEYQDDAFTAFLVDVCYPLLDWTNGPNWHASFADSRLAIAAYVGDRDLWEDAKGYFYTRLGQSIYHASFDGGQVLPLLNEQGTPNVGLTLLHWGGGVDAAQIHDDFTPVDPPSFPNGVNAERMRDLGHVSMGLGAFLQAARTVLAQGDELEPHAHDRLHAGYAHHGSRVLAYLDTGLIPEPEPLQGDGGTALRQGWLGACKLFGDDTPADVLTLCGRDEVTGFAPAGANHLVAEPFVDER